MPLHLTYIKGHIDVVELLLDKGADVEAKDKFGDTPLHIASFWPCWCGQDAAEEGC